MTEASVPSVDAVILAGGRARRLGEQDKGLVELAGRPLVAWVAARVAPQVNHLAISANRNLERYAALAYPVVPDHLPGQPGPLAGILAASTQLAGEWLLAVPCDLPFLPADLVRRLHAHASVRGLDAVYASEPEQAHYAVMLLRRKRLSEMADYVAGGGRQVRAWLERGGAQGVPFISAGPAFFNINTPEDLDQAGRIAAAFP